jgi:hypothetical protein
MKRNLRQALEEIIERVSNGIRKDVTVDAYLAGGIAAHMHVADRLPANDLPRYSEDADIYFRRALNIPDDIVVLYQDHHGKERALVLDRNYNPELGPYHPDAFDRATPLFTSQNGRVRLRILAPVDLAITKIGRFQDHDRFDIEALAKCGLLDADEFMKLAQQATDYLATDPAPVLANIRDAAQLIRKAGAR